jgi:hypothetical protein
MRFWNHLDWRGVLALAAAACFAASSLGTFWLDWPSLRTVGEFNPIVLGNYQQNPGLIRNLVIVIAVCAIALLWARAWLDVVMLAWLSAIMFMLREFAGWHLVIPMAWLAGPVQRQHVRAVRVAFLLSASALIFGDGFSPAWMARLFHPAW